MKFCAVANWSSFEPIAGHRHRVLAEIKARFFPGGLGFEHAVAGFRRAAGFGNDEHQRPVEPGAFELINHRVHAGGVGVVEEEDGQLRTLADGFGDELRAERRAADADEQELLEFFAVGSGQLAGMHLGGECLELGERAGDRLLQLRRRRELRIAQPIVADHPAFVGIGDGTRFDGLDIGKCLVDFRLHVGDEIRADVHQGQVERESKLRVAEERLLVGLPGHRGRC
jgi:hypothetical protein